MRLKFIDSLKGFLIILVAIGHIIQMSNPDFVNNLLFRYIYSFHMPLFFTVSGFVSYKENVSFDVVMKRFFQLIFPFFSWWLIHSLFDKKISLLDSFFRLLHSPDNGLWFLWVLFFCVLIFYLLDKVAKILKLNQEIVVFLGSVFLYLFYLLTNFRYLGFQFIAWYFMFYSIGIYLRKFNYIFLIKNIYLTVILTVLFFLGAWFYEYKGAPTFYHTIKYDVYISYVYKFLIAFLGINCAFRIFSYIENEKNSSNVKILSSFGNKTLGIYAIHCIFFDVFLKINTNIPYLINVILILIVSLILSYISVVFLRKNKYLSFFLLGEK